MRPDLLRKKIEHEARNHSLGDVCALEIAFSWALPAWVLEMHRKQRSQGPLYMVPPYYRRPDEPDPLLDEYMTLLGQIFPGGELTGESRPV